MVFICLEQTNSKEKSWDLVLETKVEIGKPILEKADKDDCKHF